MVDYHTNAEASSSAAPSSSLLDSAFSDDALRHLLASFTGATVDPYPAPDLAPDPQLGIPWNPYNKDLVLPLDAEQQAIADLAGHILLRYDTAGPDSDDETGFLLPESDDEANERSDDENPAVPEATTGGSAGPTETQPRKRARTNDTEDEVSRFWFPWHDRITCTLDILMHLPRSVFSHRQLDLFLWLLKVNNVDDVPSVKTMQTLNAALQKMCGIDSIAYDGALGHKYYVNDLAQIIAQEMANPKVRPHLSFYPEDSGPKLSEAKQGARWLKELPDDQTTPMVRMYGQDFYIHEPAMLRDGQCCIPTRWFTRGDEFFANCWELEPVVKETGSGWRVVIKSQPLVVPASQFLKSFPSWQRDVGVYNHIPGPTHIFEVFNEAEGTLSPWTHTDPSVGNKWRVKAKGSRVVIFPLWTYCDDTSGNLSKKWNAHNSFLFTPAGLPQKQAQKEYNIHFLCTSNIAPPLEMLDGVVDQLERAQENGIWAWDVVLNELVLVIPQVLALLGDNPMQSEFACHIGLRGKLFCRACWVKGKDAIDPQPQPETGQPPGNNSDRGSAPPSPVASDNGSVASRQGSDNGSQASGKATTGRKKFKETMAQMVSRVTDFITIGPLRKKQDTTDKLRSYFAEGQRINTKTSLKDQRTEDGIKDTYQLHFLEKLFESYKSKHKPGPKQAALDAKVAELNRKFMGPGSKFADLFHATSSPVWRIKGLDPHQDTPVEILHIVLLGFVKYMWRDVVQNQLKNKDEKLDLLMTRLSSLDVSGLGISPLAGRTLVKYSGSLTGRDFRAIAQVAPFVIYDLVPSDCFETWQALSKMIPLIWQPEIVDLESHLTLLTQEIDRFLLCAARWTNRWFNKPKFHIILHLPNHIRRFGPAISFATEGFESFNAVIRAKSVHTNRQAPSRDIAQAFAQGNRIRHLLSGGKFFHTTTARTDGDTRNPFLWKSIAAGPQHLVNSPSTITSYLGLDLKNKLPQGSCTPDKDKALVPIAGTLIGKHIAAWSTKPGTFRTCKELVLNNGDVCRPGKFVVLQDSTQAGGTRVGQVEEIVQRIGSVAYHASLPDGILVRQVIVSKGRPRYGMPSVLLQEQRALCELQDLLCTVNVQHNCMDNACGPTGTAPVRQEQAKTTHTVARIAHDKKPDDFVLNTAQMRDAKYVQGFRIKDSPLDRETVILASAAKEVGAPQPVAEVGAPATPVTTPAAAAGRPTPLTAVPRNVSHLRNQI
ncbi:hypothetical protein FB45DRAFT_1025398 [Roridomyces roridus]|uniref:Transposase n=1 Tax=Roridomyces roridus TaxID=1738132 RepID=A0AAD7BYM4_9AGAR|nr:hypothetical protein FB45DRAFT_1025398 [Roridomyces roridus]